jgi:hypothetical protein
MKGPSGSPSSLEPVQARSLAQDDRGAIMVMGLVMGTFLIGAVWYVWGIGNAIQYRENMQNAADATAFAAAVFDARGMNIIALLNLIWTVVMMFLVAVRLIQCIVLIINIVSCIFGAFLNPICDASTAAEPIVDRWVSAVSSVVIPVCRTLHYAESGVAVVWPWLAEAKSAQASVAYAPGVVVGTTWATAMIPLSLNTPGDYANILTSATNIGGVVSGGGGGFVNPFAGKGVDGAFKGRFGLPVQNDSGPAGCSIAGEFVLNTLSLPLTKIPVIGGEIGGLLTKFDAVIGFITGQLPSFFCGNDSSAIMGAVNYLRKKAGTIQGKNAGAALPSGQQLAAQCQAQQKGATSASQNACPSGGACVPDPNNHNALPAGCGQACGLNATQAATYGQARFDNCTSAGNGPSESGAQTAPDYFPKVLYSAAAMSDDNFAVWSDVVGNWNDVATNGVQVASIFAKNKSLVGPPPTDVLTAVAKTEFYYEPRPADTVSKDLNAPPIALYTAQENVMWNMRWRARLRRFTTAAPGFSAALSSGVKNLFNSTLEEVIKGLGDKVGGPLKSYTGRATDCEGEATEEDASLVVRELSNPLCIVYAAEGKLGLPTSPGSAKNPDGLVPNFYH